MLVDSHCHLDRLDLTPYDGCLAELISAAQATGVTGILCVAIDRTNIPVVLDIAEQFPQVYASVGVHPLAQDAELTMTQLLALAAHPKVVAIGETGLDYYYDQKQVARQKQNFVTHLQAAGQCGKPLIIHSRDAKEDTLALMRQHANPDYGGVMHCFTGYWEMAKQAIDMNFYISFSGIVTFKNALSLREVAKKVPLERLLIETDAPYLAPVPYRGKSNEPKYLTQVATSLAAVKGISVAALAEATSNNYRRLFRCE